MSGVEAYRISWAALWVLAALLAAPCLCHAQQQYYVGNIATGLNWFLPSNEDYYVDWGASVTLSVSDSIRFNFDPSHYDVTHVAEFEELSSCIPSNVLSFFTQSVTLSFMEPGSYYFMSQGTVTSNGTSNDCLAGMRLIVRVVQPGSVPPPPQLQTPPPPPAPGPGAPPLPPVSLPPTAASPGMSITTSIIWARQSGEDHTTMPLQSNTILVFNFSTSDVVRTVLQVTQADYDSCNTLSKPLANYSTPGSAVVTFPADGLYYFIAGISDDCLSGHMKLKVIVGPLLTPTTTRRFPIVVAVAVPCGIVFILGLALVVFLYCRHHYPTGRHEERRAVTSGTVRPATWFAKSGENSAVAITGILQGQKGGNQCTVFTFEELQRATNSFSKDAEAGSGGFGTVYKGTLEDGRTVAIKMAKHASDVESFVNEVCILSGVNNRNLVKLLGYSVDMDIPLLVYEFIPNGNLQDHLSLANKGFSTHLDWNLRFKIALQTAEALKYLHVQATPPIFHRDVKSANILLDHNYNAKVADFGFSKLVDVEATHVSTLVKGTPGYLDPEYYFNAQLTDKSDVYSFGMLLLELITSKKPIDLSKPDGEQNLAITSIRMIKAGKFRDIIGTHVSSNLCRRQLQEIEAVAKVAAACLVTSRAVRPSMTEVLEMLQRIKGSQLKAEEFYDRAEAQDTVICMGALVSQSGRVDYEAASSSQATFSSGSRSSGEIVSVGPR